ncbi:MAG: hypothetical protein LC107_12030 [Chitinophagales bacterium]|nr:hypothetical protein [Chitinophagales bacterium]
MKKVNYFSSLVVLLLLFFGVSLNAQSFISKNDAIRVVKTVIKDNTSASSSSVISNDPNDVAIKVSLDKVTLIKDLKVKFGETMLSELKGPATVSEVFAKAKSTYEVSYKSRGQYDAYLEVEDFYAKLLQK